MENKAKTLTRRNLLAHLLEWPAKLAGLSAIMGAVPLVTTGCGETKVSGPTDPQVQNPPKPVQQTDISEDAQVGLGSPQEDLLATGEDSGDGRSQETSTSTPSNNQPATAEGSGATRTRNTSLVQGARPNGGFFSRGAPRLTKEQIEAGQPIEATCEGTNHKLTITSEQLAQLAEGKTVQVRSATNTHFGNPTVHNHVVTYTPVRA